MFRLWLANAKTLFLCTLTRCESLRQKAPFFNFVASCFIFYTKKSLKKKIKERKMQFIEAKSHIGQKGYDCNFYIVLLKGGSVPALSGYFISLWLNFFICKIGLKQQNSQMTIMEQK